MTCQYTLSLLLQDLPSLLPIKSCVPPVKTKDETLLAHQHFVLLAPVLDHYQWVIRALVSLTFSSYIFNSFLQTRARATVRSQFSSPKSIHQFQTFLLATTV